MTDPHGSDSGEAPTDKAEAWADEVAGDDKQDENRPAGSFPCAENFSPHVKPPIEGHAKIDWMRSVRRACSVRVSQHTCECTPTIYEKCAAGGLGHIRRTIRTADGDRVAESPWIPAARANALWFDLLEGRAR